MLAKESIKTLVGKVAPGVLNRRFIKLNTAKEPEIMLLPLMAEKNMLAVDVGANQGLYVHHLLSLTRDVVAFEPLAPMQATLRRVYGARIRLESVALSNAPGFAEIRFPEGEYPLATLEPSNDLSVNKSKRIVIQKTELRTLDSYDFDNLGILKIDVEGHEEAVIKGGYETLRRNRPALIIEIEERHNSGSVKRVDAMLKALGYDGFFICEGMLRNIEDFDVDLDQSRENIAMSGKTGRYINNFMFIPQTRSETFKTAAAKLLAN